MNETKRTNCQLLAKSNRPGSWCGERTRTTWEELLAGAKVGERFRPLGADSLRREQK